MTPTRAGFTGFSRVGKFADSKPTGAGFYCVLFQFWKYCNLLQFSTKNGGGDRKTHKNAYIPIY